MPERILAGSLLDEQIQREIRSISEGVRRYRQMVHQAVARGEGSQLKPAERLLVHWYVPLVEMVRRDQRRARANKPTIGMKDWGKVICQVNARKIAVVALHTLLAECCREPAGVPFAALGTRIGSRINAVANLPTVREDREGWRRLSKTSRRGNFTEESINREAARIDRDLRWSIRERTQLGIRMAWHIITSASAGGYCDGEFRLAFHHETRTIRGKTFKTLRLDSKVIDLLEEGHAARQHLRPVFQPMIVPPLPWTDTSRGGYYRIRRALVQPPHKAQAEAMRTADMSRVHAAVNRISGTGWRINRFVLETQRFFWEQGGNIAGVPHRDPLPMPSKPHDIATNKEARRVYSMAAAETWKTNAMIHGLREQYSAALETASDLGERVFYFPHQLDFRGRLYPIAAHLNYQGPDPIRAMFMFSDAAPVTDRARYWLKVHLANCCGMDKIPFASRVQWVDDTAREWVSWAKDPIENQGWMGQDKPWQSLAAAAECLNAESGSTCLPIQMDGSCNGLQHYAAMGRDADGAAVVNMLPSDGPADIYSIVAKRVADVVSRDAERGERWGMRLDGMIDRKVVKQTVMTTTYGVTMVGARMQIYERLREKGVHRDDLYAASIYLAKIVSEAVEGSFRSARQIMDWLRDVARSRDGLVQWTTPLGFPAVQPYQKLGSERVDTNFGKVRILNEQRAQPQRGKHTTAFAPNYVHSIDATHLMMTAMAMPSHSPFAGVHDSYWTTAPMVDDMHRVLREQFVALHSGGLLEDLGDNPPPRGNLNIKDILNAPYFFS